MRIHKVLLSLLLITAVGCHHNKPPEEFISQPSPIADTTPQTPPQADAPAVTSTAEDDAIIAEVLANGESRDVSASATNDRAVVFGDNYVGTPAELHECVNDAKKNVINLVKVEKFSPKNIRLFLNEKCTKENYEAWGAWVMAEAKPGDRRFFANSSHGAEDTDSQGRIIDVLVTYSMIQKNVWNATTEVSPEFWATLLRSTSVNFLFINDSCHAGGQMRKTLGIAALKNKRTVRSIDGPAIVQARIDAATERGQGLRSLALTGSVVWACQPSELSEEDSIHGGLGTDAYWKSRKALVASNPKIGDIIREANRILHTEYAASQHAGLTGVNKIVFSKD